MDSWHDISSELLEKCMIEIKKKENMKKIHSNVIDPLIDYILEKLYPYIMVMCVMFTIMMFFLIIGLTMGFKSYCGYINN